MLLTLRVQSRSGQPLAQAVSADFSTAGGTIGRSPGNTLVLEDPGKTISRTHARIAFRDGRFLLADMGSNPSMINERVLGIGKEAPLAHGDRIRIGDYVLEAQARENATALAAPQAARPLPPATPPLSELTVPDDPAQMSVPPSKPASALPDSLAAARILDGGGLSADAQDPLGLGLFSRAPDSASRAAESDHAPPQFQAFPVDATPFMAIPDDYDPLADRLPSRRMSAPPFSFAPAATEFAAPAAPAAYTAKAPAMVVVEAVPSPAPTAAASASAAASVPQASQAPQAPRAPTAPQVLAAPQAPSSAAGADSEVMRALLHGLGLPDLTLKKSPVDSAEQIGAMLRIATAGAMAALLARALTKRESRIEMTMIARKANNPLKFFPDAGGALTQMLTDAMPGYMNAVQAYTGAFDDLKAHELAVMAGMQSALSSVLARFDPAAMEADVAKEGMLDKMLPAHRKARMWDRMVELYREVTSEADHDFQRLFGDRFAKAYEEQVRALRERE